MLHQLALEAVEARDAMQKPTELGALLAFLAPRRIRNVLEIGGMYGGTLWAWSQISTGKLVCVDAEVLDGRMENAADFSYTGIKADSTKLSTRDQVQELVGGQRFDFVFIDGDHRYSAVTEDAGIWWPMVAPGGVMAFHDICHRYIGGVGQHHDMWRFWKEFSRGKTSFGIYDPIEPWGGIGVVLRPPIQHIYELPPHAQTNLPMPTQCTYPICGRCRHRLEWYEVDICVECAE